MQKKGDNMPIYRRCSRCRKRIASGSRCECEKERYKERYRDYDRLSRDKKSKEFYDSREWDCARGYALDADGGIDVYLYMTTGEIKAADTVHHIAPIRDAWDRRLDISNLMSLHHDTHSMIEQLYKKDKTKMQEMLKNMLKEYRESVRD